MNEVKIRERELEAMERCVECGEIKWSSYMIYKGGEWNPVCDSCLAKMGKKEIEDDKEKERERMREEEKKGEEKKEEKREEKRKEKKEEGGDKKRTVEEEKEYLRRVGFIERRNGDKTQFIKEIDGVILGRTYNERFRKGRFWGIKDGKMLSDEELKQIGDVKAFYEFREGKREMPELPVPKGEEEMEKVVKTVKKMAMEAKGTVYKIGDHEEPSAALVQKWANEAGISVEIKEAIQTDEYAKAVVRCSLNGQVVEDCVIHHFNTAKDRIALEIIEKMEKEGKRAIEGFDEEGRPILTQEAKYRIFKKFIRFKDFAIRDAVSKATRRAELKLLNREWRNQEEIEAEVEEVKVVNRGE
ncbi:hypothetical protein DRN97_04165 [Methanosarcinales archaeon]|nr:MAG: hypothetical protein DRN97_04165 [Methanosarcinales archaeon]